MTEIDRAIKFFENALENCVVVARNPFETALSVLRRTTEAEAAWVSVEDRLPSSGEHVLVSLESGAVTEAMILQDEFLRPEMFAYRAYRFETNKVTHWMPLPPPPKED